MRLPDSEAGSIPTLLFCTINGVIGVVASLPEAMFQKLTRLQVYPPLPFLVCLLITVALIGTSNRTSSQCVCQTCLRKVVKGVGGLSHSEWRTFENERRSGAGRAEDHRNFVDGDLIEQFLDLRCAVLMPAVRSPLHMSLPRIPGYVFFATRVGRLTIGAFFM
jgi:DNA damage-binding protein 1